LTQQQQNPLDGGAKSQSGGFFEIYVQVYAIFTAEIFLFGNREKFSHFIALIFCASRF